jgi:hypothetical protein
MEIVPPSLSLCGEAAQMTADLSHPVEARASIVDETFAMCPSPLTRALI